MKLDLLDATNLKEEKETAVKESKPKSPKKQPSEKPQSEKSKDDEGPAQLSLF
jgi:hypothetical protein